MSYLLLEFLSDFYKFGIVGKLQAARMSVKKLDLCKLNFWRVRASQTLKSRNFSDSVSCTYITGIGLQALPPLSLSLSISLTAGERYRVTNT